MTINIIQQRLTEYQCQNALEEEMALKEITQDIILMSLARQKFFALAEFHGGTALRILYGLDRFSEDLDFALLHSDKNFQLSPYLKNVKEELEAFGYQFEIQDRSSVDKTVKKAFLKDGSIGKLLLLKTADSRKKIKIKLECDANPPTGADTEIKQLHFPTPFGVRAKTLESSFAGKLHALLCRPYVKGRDWFDFCWYVNRKTEINLTLLQNALVQCGPWENQKFKINADWVKQELLKKINTIDWQVARDDVSRFIKPYQRESLSWWSVEFFQEYIERL